MEIRLGKRQLKKIVDDATKSADLIDLVYVSDRDKGISRIRKEEGFSYQIGGHELNDENELARIKSLAIPPSWINVWICALPNGHLQATGFDLRNRKQYRYHHLWCVLRNHTKFFHLYDFGVALPAIRKQIEADIMLPGLPLNKILATLVSLMLHTSIRIGNEVYEKQNGSIGLTTMKNRNVSIHGADIRLSFKGKKGVYHDIKLKDRRLAKIIGKCKDLPGRELFQFLDDNGQRHSIDSGMVNNYIKEISGNRHFTAKDFRTWSGSLHALQAFSEIGDAESEADAKRKIVNALDRVAKHLGNTRTVCKKYYVHPQIIDHYSNSTLSKYFVSIDESASAEDEFGKEEKVLMRILKETKEVLIS